MKNFTHKLRRKLVAVLVLSLMLPVAAPRALADNNSQITVQVGQPNIWSLGQAHYLLSVMRDTSRGIGVQVPVPTDLDPNSANGARLDVLRSLLSAGAELNTPIGTQNRLNRQKFDTEFARYQAAQSRIDEILPSYTQAVSEVTNLKIQLDALPADNPDNKEPRRKLTDQIAQRTAERDALKAEIDELRKTQAATALSLSSVSPPGAITTNTPPDDLKSVFDAIVKGSAVPKLNASTVLDNYILMQYEVIAKQLTLLRDEVGPDQRLIFLELPMSVYSVPKQDDDYVVQTQWNVTQFLRPNAEQRRGRRYGQRGFSGENINLNVVNAELRDVLNYIKEQFGINFLIDESVPPTSVTANMTDVPWNEVLDSILAANNLGIEARGNIFHIASLEALSADDNDDDCARAQLPPISLDEQGQIRTYAAEGPCQASDQEHLEWAHAAPSKFRVVDIIPRQSALNVNDVHGTQNGFALTAKFLSVFGFGGQVGYQRQRSIYEQFLQQEVYASAFGKGLSNFGWTFGPLPGTKRLAPGVRTTYAILVIPKEALGVELNVQAKVYKRDRSPEDSRVVKLLPQADEGLGNGTFRILVPNERTEGFWVDKIFYTPVEKGKNVTVVMQGKYFSPLTGILVNGISLKRTVSIGRNELPPNPPAGQPPDTGSRSNSGMDGEFEYLNPQQLVLSFKMGESYVGTPLITLVTPEKTSVINYFPLEQINTHDNRSLSSLSRSEPMFRDKFSLTSAELADGSRSPTVIVLLRGAGFQPDAEIFVDSTRLSRQQAQFITSGTYRLRFQLPPGGDPVRITYRHTTRQTTQEASVLFQQTITSNYQIVRYQPAIRRNPAVLDVVLSILGNAAAPQVSVDRRDGNLLGNVSNLGGGRYSLQIEALRDPVAISVTAGGVTTLFDIGIPLAPSIDRVVNTATGKPEGPASKPAVVTLHGTNFGHVTRVFFGAKEATIMQVDPQVILVNAPAGEEGVIQVLLETNINLRGRIVSNAADFRTAGRAVYTYTK